jgi:head-tail adaptor
MAREVAGLLVERVMIERREEARDDLGGDAGEWVEEVEVWAGVSPDRGGVDVSGGARRGERRWAVTVRRRDGLGLDRRLIWRGRVLRVHFVEDDPRVGDVVTLRCEEEPCLSG